MGYTHYWEFPKRYNKRNYTKAVKECRKIVSYAMMTNLVSLAGPLGEAGTRPTLDPSGDVHFNGVEEDAHETFALGATPIYPHPNPARNGFNFCKTAAKPYDVVVVACLCALKDCMNGGISVSSDGESEDWEEGRALAEEVLGRKIPNPIKA